MHFNNKMCFSYLISGLLGVSALVSSGNARAATVLTSPYASANIFVGLNFSDSSDNVIIFCNTAGSGVTEYHTAAPLAGDLEIVGGSGADSMYVLNGYFDAQQSGWCHGPATRLSGAPNYGTHYADLHGGGGNDYLSVHAPNGDSWCWGDGGNDRIDNYSSIGRVIGWTGNDILKEYASSGSDGLEGGDDQDCLYDASGSAAVFDCGGNSAQNLDTYMSAAPNNMVNCEVLVSSCP